MRPDVAAALAALADDRRPRLLAGVDWPPSGSDAGEPCRRRPRPAADGGEPAGEPVYDARRPRRHPGQRHPGVQQGPPALPVPRVRRPRAARRWLRWLAPRLATMDDVLAFVRASGAERLRPGAREPRADRDLGQRRVLPRRDRAAGSASRGRDAFGDQSFRQGLAARSTYLGDPSTPPARATASRWMVGGPSTEADVLVIVAADSARRPATTVAELVEAGRRARARGGLRAARRHAARRPARATSTSASRTASPSRACAAAVRGRRRLHHAALPRAADPHARAVRQARPAAGLAGPVPARRAAPGHAGPVRARRRRPRTSRRGRGAGPTWSAGGCARTSRRSGTSWPTPRARLGLDAGALRRACSSAAGRAARR